MQQISISIDDGHSLDLKMADVLLKNELKAVFYIPIKRNGEKRLTNRQIRNLSSEFEIGSHTYSHQDLTKISLREAQIEIIKGKKTLEDILGKKVSSFAFPFGRYNDQLINLVKKAGFNNCRSGRIINFHNFNNNDFLLHPNLQVYPHSILTDLKHCLKYGDFYSFSQLTTHINKSHLGLIDFLLRLKNVHFWCHSEDIEKFNLWDFFHLLKSVGG